MRRLLSLLGTCLSLTACASAGEPFATPEAEGRFLAQRDCAGCHNANATGRSIFPTAPPLRLFAGETPDSLRRRTALARGEAHVGMPQIMLTEGEAAALYAYIRSLSAPAAPEGAPVIPCIADAMC